MTYRDFDYRIVQSVDDPDKWIWMVWIGDELRQGSVKGGHSVALQAIKKLVDSLVH